MKISTRELMDTLGVSRSWVNTYLRHLGQLQNDGGSRRKAHIVYYDTEDVLQWLNENAVFDRQIVRRKYSYYGRVTDEEAISTLHDIKQMLSIEQRAEARRAFFKRALPKDLFIALDKMEGSERARKGIPWATATDIKIKTFEQLLSIRKISEQYGYRSDEMAYRHIYRNGMIRVTIQGRSWYIDDLEVDLSLTSFTLPAVLW